jgi:multidrug efflux pump subunit AcrB
MTMSDPPMAGASQPLGASGRLVALFQRNHITPLMALVALLLGLFAVFVTPREEEPQINVTMANVMIPFPGASVKDVEQLVASPAEQVLAQIAGIEHVYSQSRPGLAVLTVQFKVGVPRIDALVRLYDTVNSNRDWLPVGLGVLEPIIKPRGIDDVPILTLTLWSKSPELSAFDLERVAHAMEIELKRVAGTREVNTIGGSGHVVNVWLDAQAMRNAGITTEQVRSVLQGRNVAADSGNLVQDNRLISVQAGEFLANARDVAQVVVGTGNGKPVYLEDVARIEAGPSLPAHYVWHGIAKPTSGGPAPEDHPAVTLQITKKPGENAPAVAAALTQRVEQLHNTVIPGQVEVSVTRNYGATANDKAQKLIQKLLFATASVIALVWLALGHREALIVGLAVVLTLAATLFASWAWGFTLNRVSLFALIFSIGILVDDAIVVVENIHRHHLLNPDKALWQLIPAAVDEVGGPTILATFTVIAALLPMAFVSGLMGPYMSPIPINSSMGMLISLVIAFTVTPWMANRWLAHGSHGAAQAPKVNKFAGRIDSAFHKVLTPFLEPQRGARNRRILWVSIALLIVLSVSLAAAKLVVLKMLPFDNKSELQVVVDLPADSPVERTAAVLREMGAYLAQVPEVTDYQAYAGAAAPINFNGLVRQYYLRAAPELGDLQVNLLDKHLRKRKSHEIAGAVRPALQSIAAAHGARVKVVEVPPGPPVLAPIVAEVYGPDNAGRQAVAKRIEAAFLNTADIVDVDSSSIAAAPKLHLKVLTQHAAQLGVAHQSIASTLQTGLAGADVTYLRDGTSRYAVPVRISLPPQRQARVQDLLQLAVRSSSGVLVPLEELVQVSDTLREQPAYHKDLMPLTYVFGDMAGKTDSPLYGMFDIRSSTVGAALPQGGVLGEYFIRQPSDPYRQYAVKWDGEWQITYETFRDMGAAYAVGLVLIYLLVVVQFKSYVTPLVIMAPIPLTIIGVMPGHAVLGAQFTATSMIGMIALAGIIVRNSILLVDFINLQVSQGVAFRQAVIQSAAVRAQPIALTGLAAMLGALFILDDPIFNGLAIALVFGIFVSTILTLVVIPVLYYAANRRQFEQIAST